MLMKNKPSLFWGKQRAESSLKVRFGSCSGVDCLMWIDIWWESGIEVLLYSVIWDWRLQTKTTMEIMAIWKWKFSASMFLLLCYVLSNNHICFRSMLMVGQALQMHEKVFMTKTREWQRKVLGKVNFQALWHAYLVKWSSKLCYQQLCSKRLWSFYDVQHQERVV